MICKVKETLDKFCMCENTDEIIVGFSGGADSVCLLHILNSLKGEYGFSVRAAHVNHCLRGEESERDEKFVRDFCLEHGIELSVLKTDVLSGAKENSMGIEEYGRKVRYDFFQTLLSEKSKIATAHNLNDTEETFLFNLARGSSLKGLTSIPPVRDNIIRPIIECSREEIEEYCRSNGLKFVIDSTNLSDEYTRNKIRHNVIPVLKEINPSFDKSILRCLNSLREDEDYLKRLSDNLYEEVRCGNSFDADKLKNEDISLQKRIISRIVYEKCGVLPESKHISLILAILNGGKVELFDRETLIVRHGKLYFLSDVKKREITETTVSFDSSGMWSDNYISLCISESSTQKVYKELVISTLDYGKICGNLVLRKRQEGDKITLPIRKVTKSLKKLFNEMKISPEERDNIFVLADDKSVVWVEKIGVDARVVPGNDTKKYVNICLSEEDYA